MDAAEDLGREVEIAIDSRTLDGFLGLPQKPKGIGLFAHGSGSSRLSPRNQAVAASLREQGLATLLFDLLTPVQEQGERVTRHLRFDIDFLSKRLATVMEWLRRHEVAGRLPIGYFGSSTGAAAALVAAATHPVGVAAVVSRGGRPDLAEDALGRVQAPTLFIVGGNDTQVLSLNRKALAALGCEQRLDVVPGATHLFEEPGTLEQAADRAGDAPLPKPDVATIVGLSARLHQLAVV